MLWIRPILAAACCYFLLVAATLADTIPVASPIYECPAYLQLDARSYVLDVEHVYDGPIEEQFILKPEPVPDDDGVEPSFWDYGRASPNRPFHIKCIYKDTGHYLVLEAKGARRCTFTDQTPTRCE